MYEFGDLAVVQLDTLTSDSNLEVLGIGALVFTTTMSRRRCRSES